MWSHHLVTMLGHDESIFSTCWKPNLAYNSCSTHMHCSMKMPECRWDGSHPLCLISSMPENSLLFDFPDAPSKSEKTLTPAPEQVHWYMAVKHWGVGEVGPIIRPLGGYICTFASIFFSRGSEKKQWKHFRKTRVNSAQTYNGAT